MTKTGLPANFIINPSSWRSFEAVLPSLRWYTGIGFVLTGDGIIGIDLDKCRDPETGATGLWALAIVERFATYTEVSPSGTGLHILLRGKLPSQGRRTGHVEIYGDKHYIAITGHRLDSTPATLGNRPDELLALYQELFPPGPVPPSAPLTTPTTLDDHEVVERAMGARNGGRFLDLWHGPPRGYPSPSEADFALCLLLAFWTGRNADQIDRLFRRSSLMRPKWDEPRGHATYGAVTIQKAIATCRHIYTPTRALNQGLRP